MANELRSSAIIENPFLRIEEYYSIVREPTMISLFNEYQKQNKTKSLGASSFPGIWHP